MISTLQNLLKLVLWPRIRYISVNVLCVGQKNVYSVLLDALFSTCHLGQVGWQCRLSLLNTVLPITETGLLKSPIVIMGLCIFLCSSTSFCFMHFQALLLDAYTFRILEVFLINWPFYHIKCPFCLVIFLVLKFTLTCSMMVSPNYFR